MLTLFFLRLLFCPSAGENLLFPANRRKLTTQSTRICHHLLSLFKFRRGEGHEQRKFAAPSRSLSLYIHDKKERRRFTCTHQTYIFDISATHTHTQRFFAPTSYVLARNYAWGFFALSTVWHQARNTNGLGNFDNHHHIQHTTSSSTFGNCTRSCPTQLFMASSFEQTKHYAQL